MVLKINVIPSLGGINFLGAWDSSPAGREAWWGTVYLISFWGTTGFGGFSAPNFQLGARTIRAQSEATGSGSHINVARPHFIALNRIPTRGILS